MNALASAPGWRDLAIRVMPPAVYALASDTLIGVVRALAVARATRAGQALAGDEPTPMAALAGLLLWLLRLAVAPASTIAGFRRWAVEECPAALPLKRVSPIASAIAAEVSLSPGTARQVLLAHVRSVQPDGTVVLIDLERFAFGPPESDLAVTATEHLIGWHASGQYATFCQVYGFDVAGWPGFPVIRAVNELKMTTWLMQNVRESEQVAAEFRTRLASLRGDDAPRQWRPF